jgi:hypothetical protein
MSGLYGKKAEEFVEWLDKAKHVLSGATTIDEARKIWEKQQEELKNAQKKQ